WDTATGREIRHVTGPENGCYCLAFTPDGRTLTTAGTGDGQVRFWDPATGQELHHWAYPWNAMRLAVAPDGTTLAVGGGGMIRLREAPRARDVLPRPGPPDGILSVAFTPDGETLIASSADGSVGLWEAATGKPRSPLRGPPRGRAALPPRAYQARVARDGRLAAALDDRGTIRLWDTAARHEPARLDRPPALFIRLALSPDGRALAAVHQDNTL